MDEILDVVNNANFLQTFPNEFEIFSEKIIFITKIYN